MGRTAALAATAVAILGRFNALAARIGRDLAALLVAAMTGIVLVGVFFRYALGDALAWTEDSSVLAMIWVAFLVAPWAYRYGGNVSIDMAVDRLSPVPRRLLRVALNLLVLWILARFFAESLAYVGRGWRMRANTVPLPIAWFRLVLPVSLLAMALVGLELILRDLLSLARPDRDWDVPRIAGAIEPE